MSEREGPKISGYTCEGCKHRREVRDQGGYWDGALAYYRCDAENGEKIAAQAPTPPWCPFLPKPACAHSLVTLYMSGEKKCIRCGTRFPYEKPEGGK